MYSYDLVDECMIELSEVYLVAESSFAHWNAAILVQ